MEVRRVSVSIRGLGKGIIKASGLICLCAGLWVCLLYTSHPGTGQGRDDGNLQDGFGRVAGTGESRIQENRGYGDTSRRWIMAIEE